MQFGHTRPGWSLPGGQTGAGAMCKVKGCSRPVFAEGRCGYHALQGYYRTTAAPGVGLTATRVPGPPRVLQPGDRADADPPEAPFPGL